MPFLQRRITASWAVCCQHVEGVDSAPVLSTGEAEPAELLSTREIQSYWRVQQRVSKVLGGWSPLKRGWRRWGCSGWRREGLEEDLIDVYKNLKGRSKDDEARG